jgi:hypothetical protein
MFSQNIFSFLSSPGILKLETFCIIANIHVNHPQGNNNIFWLPLFINKQDDGDAEGLIGLLQTSKLASNDSAFSMITVSKC